MAHGYKAFVGENCDESSGFGEEDTVTGTLETVLTDWLFGPALGNLSNVGNIASAFAAGLAAIALALSPVSIGGAEGFGQPSVSVVTYLTNVGNIASAATMGQPSVRPNLAPAGIASVGAYGTPSASQVIASNGITSGAGFGQGVVGLTIAPAGIGAGGAFGNGAVVQIVAASSIGGAEAFGTPELEEITEAWLYPASIIDADEYGQPSLAARLSANSLDAAGGLGEPSISWAYNLFVDGIAGTEEIGTVDITRDYILAKIVKNKAGQVVSGADVFLFDSYTKALIGQTTTDATGQWIFHLPDQYSHYFVVVFKGDFAGITRNTLVAL